MTPPSGGRPTESDRRPPSETPTEPGHPVSQAMQGLFGRDSLYVVFWVLQVAATALLTPVITRVLRPSEYGVVAASVAVMQVLFVLAGCGLNVAIQRQFAVGGGRTAASGLLTLSLGVAVALTSTALLTGRWWGPLLGFGGFPAAVQFAVLWAGAGAVTASCLALLRSQDRLVAFATVSCLQSLVAGVVALTMTLVVQSTAQAFVLGQAMAQFAAAAVGLVLARPRTLTLMDRHLVRAGLSFALPLVPALLGGLLLGSADRFLVQRQMGAEAVAQYQVAYNIGSLPLLVLFALDSTWLPRIFAVEDSTDREAILTASRTALYRLLAPVMLGLTLASPVVLRLWAPPEFQTGDLLLTTAIIVVSAVPYAAGLSATRGLLARSATGTVAAAAIVATAVNVGLNLWLIPRLGLSGAALATFVAYALQHVMLVRSAGPVRPKWPQRQWVVPAGLGCVATVATVLLPVGPLGLTVRLLLAFGCLAWFARVLTQIAPGASARLPLIRQRRSGVTAVPVPSGLPSSTEV